MGEIDGSRRVGRSPPGLSIAQCELRQNSQSTPTEGTIGSQSLSFVVKVVAARAVVLGDQLAGNRCCRR